MLGENGIEKLSNERWSIKTILQKILFITDNTKTMCKMQKEIYLNRSLIFALTLCYTQYRVNLATTNSELTTHLIFEIVAIV
jgi:uncharacterized protein YwgA